MNAAILDRGRHRHAVRRGRGDGGVRCARPAARATPPRAVRAAGRDARPAARARRRVGAEGLAPFGLGIGLSTGEVAAALLGSRRSGWSTRVVGDTVNLAQRLQDLARPAGPHGRGRGDGPGGGGRVAVGVAGAAQRCQGPGGPVTAYRLRTGRPGGGRRSDRRPPAARDGARGARRAGPRGRRTFTAELAPVRARCAASTSTCGGGEFVAVMGRPAAASPRCSTSIAGLDTVDEGTSRSPASASTAATRTGSRGSGGNTSASSSSSSTCSTA